MAALNLACSLVLALAALSLTSAAEPPTCGEAIAGCGLLPCITKEATGDVEKCLTNLKTGKDICKDTKQVDNALVSARIACALPEVKDKKDCLKIVVPCTANVTEDEGSCGSTKTACEAQDTTEPKCGDAIGKFFEKYNADDNAEAKKCVGLNADLNITCADKKPIPTLLSCYDTVLCRQSKDLPVFVMTTLCTYSADSAYNDNKATCTFDKFASGIKAIKDFLGGGDDVDCGNRKKAEAAWKEDDACKTARAEVLNKVFKSASDCDNGAGQLLAPTALMLVLLAVLANAL